MAGGAGGQAARRIARVIEQHPAEGRGGCPIMRQVGVKCGHSPALFGAQRLRDPLHPGVLAPTVGKSFELPLEIAGIEPRQPWRSGAGATAVDAVACEAGIGRARSGAAMGDHLSGFCKAVKRLAVRGGASGQKGTHGQKDGAAHPTATPGSPRRFRWLALVPLLVITAACKPPPDERQFMPLADRANGKAAIEQAGCGACHTIPGLAWPKGEVGPRLDGLAERGLIAGSLPNRPDVLVAYIRNAPALVPGSAMPAMPVSAAQARDIAAYLYEQGAD